MDKSLTVIVAIKLGPFCLVTISGIDICVMILGSWLGVFTGRRIMRKVFLSPFLSPSPFNFLSSRNFSRRLGRRLSSLKRIISCLVFYF